MYNSLKINALTLRKKYTNPPLRQKYTKSFWQKRPKTPQKPHKNLPKISQKPHNMNQTKTFAQIAEEIRSDWKKIYFGAVPYLDALSTMHSSDASAKYFSDSAKTIVAYFLANASTWRGPVAASIKAELKKMIK